MIILSEIKIVSRPEVKALAISSNVSMWKMPTTMKNNFLNLAACLKANNADICEPPFARYSAIEWQSLLSESKLVMFFKSFTKKWLFQTGFPVQSALSPTNANMEMITLPAGKYVTALHKGSYMKVGDTYKKMVLWANAQNIALAPESIEVYTSDPRITAKESLETQLFIPLA